MSDFSALVLSLPTRNSTLRMRIWRALKDSGCGALRDGVYLLPEGGARTGQRGFRHRVHHRHRRAPAFRPPGGRRRRLSAAQPARPAQPPGPPIPTIKGTPA